MKKFIAMTAAIVLSSAVIEVHAEEAASCEDISELSKSIMSSRQNGVGMPKMMGVADGNELVEMIVIQAYEHPAYSTADFKQKTIRQFADEWYLDCVKARR